MKIEEKIIVRNYKCFDSNGGGFDFIYPINVIIGKNNSGKSSLLQLVKFLTDTNQDFLEDGRNGNHSEVLIEHVLTGSEISKIFLDSTSGGGIIENHGVYGKRLVGSKYLYVLERDGKKEFISIDYKYSGGAGKYIKQLSNVIKHPFHDKVYCSIAAERDVAPEESVSPVILKSNGSGATNYIQNIINKTDQDSRIVEEELLKELNTIINPEIEFKRLLVQLDNKGKWELFFIDSGDNRIALSKMGSGIKTILLVLLNLIVRPKIEGKLQSNYIFAFEELENNLHPSMQRRLYSYLKKYIDRFSCYLFLTTHSNVVIDSFGLYENAQMIHVVNNKGMSNTSKILTYENSKSVLTDLGVKASDLLQSNGVIWVEGPSDRIYINRWLEILAPSLREGLHYSIMFYGGKLLANLSFDYEWFNSNIIPLLKINQNAFVIMDRDGTRSSTALNKTKQRVIKEIGKNNYWVTKGREIENYLTNDTINTWLKEKHKIDSNVENDKNVKLEDNIANSDRKKALKYNGNKTIFSSEISKYINEGSFDQLDLKNNIVNLTQSINNWNSIL